MSEKLDDPLAARVVLINEAARQLCSDFYEQVILASPAFNDPDKRARAALTINAVSILLTTFIVSLSETADSVGKLARQGEQEFNASVDQAAAIKAAEQVAETNKRSFIGQPAKK